MPCLSITFSETSETAKSNSFFLFPSCARANHNSRSSSESCLESLMPRQNFLLNSFGITTPPTATGPAKGPLPASSMPTMCVISSEILTILYYGHVQVCTPPYPLPLLPLGGFAKNSGTGRQSQKSRHDGFGAHRLREPLRRHRVLQGMPGERH